MWVKIKRLIYVNYLYNDYYSKKKKKSLNVK